MFRKTVSLLLAVVAALGMLIPAAALETASPVKVTLKSAVAGATRYDTDRLISVETPTATLAAGAPISITDYAGRPEGAHMTAGRTYYIAYTLIAAEGYALPAATGDAGLTVACEKGAKLLSADISGDSLVIRAKVTADGSVLQRIIGFLHDLLLKLRSPFGGANEK